MDRILAAAEELLAESPLVSITVSEIVRHAGTSVGAFYGRFSSKEELLPALYIRRLGDLEPGRVQGYLRQFAARRMPLGQRVREIVANMVGYYEQNRDLLREMDGLTAPTPSGPAEDLRAKHEEVFREGWTASLLAHAQQIRHPEPERAVRFGLYVATATCREALVRSRSDAEHLSPEELTEELSRALSSYLGGPEEAGGGPG